MEKKRTRGKRMGHARQKRGTSTKYISSRRKELLTMTSLTLLGLFTLFFVMTSLQKRDDLGRSLLHTTPSKSLARVVLFNSVDVNSLDNEGNTALHTNSSPLVSELLLQNGAHINKQNNDGNTPLHMAVAFGWTEKVKLLVDHKADMHIKNNEKKTAQDMHHWRFEKLGVTPKKQQEIIAILTNAPQACD